MKFSPTEFWNLTLKEAELIVKGDRKRQENEFMLNVYASMNGIGLTMGGKKFKFQNPFKNEKVDEKSLIMFMGNITGVGSINFLKYPFQPAFLTP